MVEHPAVNRGVVGSSPTSGANICSAVIVVLKSELAGSATKTPSREAPQRKTLWSFVSWCLSGEILLNTLLPYYPVLGVLVGSFDHVL